MFSILIHPDLYHRLRSQLPSVRSRVRKTLLRLREGHWGGGTRVKRLAGIRRPVFEARTDSGDRLVFTAIRSADKDRPERLSTHLQVWDWVQHDEIGRISRRNLSAEADFLEFQALEEFELSEPPAAPAATFDEIESGDDPLLHYLIPPDGFETRSDEGVTGSVRWYLAPESMLIDESEFQKILDSGGSDLELKLTREQYEALRAVSPLLLSGSAGSGKTTIAVHRLANACALDEGARALYLSYSGWLVDHAKGLYRDLLVARGDHSRTNTPHFLTFTDLYVRLIPAGERQQDAGLVTGEPFERWFMRSGSALDPDLVWEEIRSILKGACLNSGKPMLDEAEYLDLGRKRAPLFVGERPEIYRIGQRYQEWLSLQKRWDQIDLCRQAIRALRHGNSKRYDVIVCDEVQDLTELEISFVLSLSSTVNLRGVMLCGDPQQVINPSGFRWSEVRQSIIRIDRTRAGAAPSILQLRKNFRSVRPVVNMANAILALRRDRFGRSDGDDWEEAIVEGPTPLQVIDKDERVLNAIRDFGPRCAIIVFDDSEGERLRESLDTSRVFHVRDAKGLEFETVVLWKSMKQETELLARLSRNDARPGTDIHFRHLLQRLYVAVTRGRRHLVIFEGDAEHFFWSAERFRHLFEVEVAAALPRILATSRSLADWTSEGDYYFERRRFRQAAECYRRAGRSEQESESLAHFAELTGNWNEALRQWRELGRTEREAISLVKLGKLAEAAELHRKLGHDREARGLEAQLLERQGRWAEAGNQWEELGEAENAARCYSKSGNRAKALTYEATQAESRKDWAQAGSYWLELKSYESAARCFKKAKDLKNAAVATARHQESLKEWAKAAAAYRRGGELQKAKECQARSLESAGQPLKAAKIWQTLGQREQAAKLVRKHGSPADLNRLEIDSLNLRESQLGRTESLELNGKFEMAIELARARQKFIRDVLPGRARKNYDKHRILLQELNALEKIEHRCRVRLAERTNDWKKAAYYWRLLWDRDRAHAAEFKAIEALNDPGRQGRQWLRLREWERAIESFQRAGNSQGLAEATARLMEQRRQWLDAAERWSTIQRIPDQSRCLAQAARQSGDWAAAAEYHRQAGQKVMARTAENRARREDDERARRAQLSLVLSPPDVVDGGTDE